MKNLQIYESPKAKATNNEFANLRNQKKSKHYNPGIDFLYTYIRHASMSFQCYNYSLVLRASLC